MEVNQQCRDRNPKAILKAIKFFSLMLPSLYEDNALNVFVLGKNPWFLLLFLLFAPKKKTVICIHNYQEHSDRGSVTLLDIIKRRFYKSFSFFLFYSQSQNHIFKDKYPSKKSYLLNMPLKDFGSPTIERYREKVTFLFFGLIRDYKRLDLLISAANEMDSTNALFVIAGNCVNWSKYEMMVKNKSIFDFHIRFIEDCEVANYFCNADYLVLPYEDATQSGPLMIALNYGLPVIASNIPEFSYIIKDGENGFLFRRGEKGNLKEVLEKASTLKLSQINEMREKQIKKRDEYMVSYNSFDIFAEIEKLMKV